MKVKERMKYVLIAIAFTLILSSLLFKPGDFAAAKSTFSMQLNKNNLTLEVGKKEKLIVKGLPGKATVSWVTDSKNIVQVSKTGTVTAIAEGTTTVKVTAVYKSTKRTCTCEITVTPIKIPLTKVQKQKASYIPISEVSSYNKKIITDKLISNCTLPEAKKESLPYWTGYILENKIYVNDSDERWLAYSEGSQYFLENEIKYLADNGFNCARVVYSFSFLSNPEDPYSINKAELEQLDELISWGLKYNVHIMISITGLPGKWNTSREEEIVNVNPELYESKTMQKLFLAYWEMLAKRYSEIPSSVLSFELIVESNLPNSDVRDVDLYCDVLSPIAQAIWKYNTERIVIVNDVYRNPPERLASIGCCLSLHTHISTADERCL
jgi:hypothetical protein